MLQLTYRELVSNLCFISAHAIFFISRATICRVAVVRKVGLEPTRVLPPRFLRPLRIPFPPLSHNYFFFCALFWLNQISFAFSDNLSFSADSIVNVHLEVFSASLISFYTIPKSKTELKQ